ncbi:hypothetical protein T07_3250, partial [Trichinella nelsoni]
LRQREGQSIQQFAQEVAELGRKAGASERDLVRRFSGGVTSKEVYRAIRLQEPPTLAEARKLATKVLQVEDGYQEKQQPRAGQRPRCGWSRGVEEAGARRIVWKSPCWEGRR